VHCDATRLAQSVLVFSAVLWLRTYRRQRKTLTIVVSLCLMSHANELVDQAVHVLFAQ